MADQRPAPPRWITAKDISGRLGVSLSTAYEIVYGLPHIRIGRLIKVRDEVFVAYIKRLERGSQKERHVLS